MTYSQPAMTNDVVASNYSTYQGAGLYVTYSSPQLRHPTIARNTGVTAASVRRLHQRRYLRNAIVAGQTTAYWSPPAPRPISTRSLVRHQADTGGPGTVVVQHAVGGDPLLPPTATTSLRLGCR